MFTIKALSQYDKALNGYLQALEIAREIDDMRFQQILLGNLAGIYVDKGDYQTGIEYGTQALKLAEARGDSYFVSLNAWNIGAGHAQQANYQAALKYYERSIGIKRQMNDKRSVGLLLGNMGNIYKDTGDIRKAIGLYSEALQIGREISHRHVEQLALGWLGYAYNGLSEYSTAIGYVQKALAMADASGNRSAKGTYLGNLGFAYKKLGDFKKALKYLNEAAALHEKIGNPRGAIPQYINIATIHDLRGDYLRGLAFEKKALDLAEKIGAKDFQATSLENIGVFYHKTGDFSEAINHLQDALKINQEIGNRNGELSVFLNMGAVYVSQQDDTKADESYQKSLNIAREIGNQESEAKALNEIGTLYQRRKSYSLALKNYDQALAIANKIGQKNEEGWLYLHKGNVFLQLDELSTAHTFYKKAFDIANAQDAFELLYESLGGIAKVEEKQSRYNLAIQHYTEAIDKIESVRERLRIESYKTGFTEGKIPIYESLITVLIKLGRYEEAYACLQRFRARSFLEILSPERRDFHEGIAPERYAGYRLLEQKLRELYDRLAGEYGRGDDKRNEIMIAALNDSLQRIRHAHRKLSDEILSHHPRYAKLTGIGQPAFVNLKDIQQKFLPVNTSVAEYFIGPELSAAFVIDSNAFHCEILDITHKKLEAPVRQLRQPFIDVKEGKIKNLADVPFHSKQAEELYRALFLPIEKHLVENQNIFIVPDGILHYLPFEMLVTGLEAKRPDPNIIFSRYENVKYLVEKYALSYLPAVSVLGSEQSTPSSAGEVLDGLLAFGSPDYGAFTDTSFATLVLKNSKGLLFKPLSEHDVLEVAQVMQPIRYFLHDSATEGRFKN